MAVQFAPTTAECDELKQVFQTINAESCPHFFNFHMHTVYSDGKLHPTVLMEQAISFGLQGLAITDHNCIGGYEVALAWLEAWKSQNPDSHAPHLWSGVEINAGLLNVDVHILGYAFDPQHPILKPYLQRKITDGKDYQAAPVIAAIQEAGGLAVLAHPARYKRSHYDLIPAAAELGIDAVEAFYAYGNPKPWLPSPKETEQVQQLAYQYNLLTTCGTDTHGTNILAKVA
jgi:predicted metal-dependent phosphoesterase TrpH